MEDIKPTKRGRRKTVPPQPVLPEAVRVPLDSMLNKLESAGQSALAVELAAWAQGALEGREAKSPSPDVAARLEALQEAVALQGQHLQAIHATLGQFVDVTNRLIEGNRGTGQNVAKIAQILGGLKDQLDGIDNDIQDLVEVRTVSPPPPAAVPLPIGDFSGALSGQSAKYRPVAPLSKAPAMPVSPAAVPGPMAQPPAPRQRVPDFKPSVTLQNPESFGDMMAFGDNH